MNLRTVALWVLAALLPFSAAAQPHVAVSIAPLHSLVAGVMTGVGEPVLLYSAARSPHTQPLTPSAAKVLADSDLVIRIGEGYEVALDKSIQGKDKNKLVNLISAGPGIELLPARKGGVWGSSHSHSHSHDETEPDNAGTDQWHFSADPHIWLSARNAAEIVRVVGRKLISLDSGNSEIYTANMNRLLERLAGFQLSLERMLEIVKDRPYVVLHDAYQYFEHEYNLTVTGSVSVDAQRLPGARTIKELNQAIVKEGVACIFLEPQFSRSMVETLAEDLSISVGELDPLGKGIDPGAELWFDMMTNLARSLLHCLHKA